MRRRQVFLAITFVVGPTNLWSCWWWWWWWFWVRPPTPLPLVSSFSTMLRLPCFYLMKFLLSPYLRCFRLSSINVNDQSTQKKFICLRSFVASAKRLRDVDISGRLSNCNFFGWHTIHNWFWRLVWSVMRFSEKRRSGSNDRTRFGAYVTCAVGSVT